MCMLAAGCGGSEKASPKPISGPPKEVADVVAQLQRATARRDFSAICDDILASAARRRAGGTDCARLLAERAGSIRRPRILVQSIEVDGGRALVRVRTTAAGQAATTDVLRMVRENGRFRISSLG